jgi:hypothetical protein
MCLLNLSFPHHRVEAGDRGQSGVGHGRVTVREGRQVVSYPQLAAATPAVQSTNASSAGVGPSLAGQLRAKAYCHERLQLITVSYQEDGAAAGHRSVIHPRRWPHRHEAFSLLARRCIPGSSLAVQSTFLQLTDVHHGLGRRFPGISSSSRAAARQKQAASL